MKPLAIRPSQRGDFPHLPPGREAGPQSLRNRTRRSFLFPFVGVVGTAMFVAGIWVAAGGRGDQFDRQEELWGGLFFAGCGLLCALVGWSNSRRVRHPRLRRGTLAVDRANLRRGDVVVATVTGALGDDSRLEVGLVCDERYDVAVRVAGNTGTTIVRQTHEVTVHEEWHPVPARASAHDATFRVPVGAPYSYEGDCVSYGWRLTARAVRRGRRDARLDRAIWVEP